MGKKYDSLVSLSCLDTAEQMLWTLRDLCGYDVQLVRYLPCEGGIKHVIFCDPLAWADAHNVACAFRHGKRMGRLDCRLSEDVCEVDLNEIVASS